MSACSGLGRNDLPQSNGEKEPIKGLEKDEMEILYLASLAPSGHNSQPWVVRILEPKHWVIGSEKKRWLPAVDPENRELSLGLVLSLKISSLRPGHLVMKWIFKS